VVIDPLDACGELGNREREEGDDRRHAEQSLSCAPPGDVVVRPR
jgi:hypothetical protein